MPSISPINLQRLVHFAVGNDAVSKSSCVFTVDYDSESKEMIVTFQQRGTYKYLDVPIDEVINFQTAGSRGKYFNNYIRDQYSFERIS